LIRIRYTLMAKIESLPDDTDVYCNEGFHYNLKLSTQVHILWAARARLGSPTRVSEASRYNSQ